MPIVTIKIYLIRKKKKKKKKKKKICLIAEKTKENRVIQPLKLIAINMH